MAKLHPLVLVCLVACGGNNSTPDATVKVIDAAPDAKVFMDAPPPMFDLSCIGNSPGAVADSVSMSGTVSEVGLGGFNALADATVDACTGDCVGGNKIATTTSAATTGAFMLGPVSTGGTAINGYIRMTHTGDRTTYSYPHAPIAQSLQNVPIFSFQNSLVPFLAQAGCTQNDGTNGMVAVVVDDCMGTRITDSANLEIAVKQSGSPVGDAPIDAGALSPMAAGVYLICNVPQNATTNVSATYKTQALLAHDVGVIKATTTLTEVRPGY